MATSDKFKVTYADGRPVPQGARFIVLRVDGTGPRREAARAAVRAYCAEVKGEEGEALAFLIRTVETAQARMERIAEHDQRPTAPMAEIDIHKAPGLFQAAPRSLDFPQVYRMRHDYQGSGGACERCGRSQIDDLHEPWGDTP